MISDIDVYSCEHFSSFLHVMMDILYFVHLHFTEHYELYCDEHSNLCTFALC